MHTKSNLTRHLYIFMAAAIVLATILSWWLASDAISSLNKARSNLAQFNDFYKVTAVSNDLAKERAFANELIISSGENKKNAWRKLEKSRRATDEDIKALPQELLTSSLLNATKAQLSSARKQVDSYKIQQLTNASAAQNAIDGMIIATDLYHRALCSKTSEFVSQAPSQLGPVMQAQALGELRDITGSLGSALLIPLATKEPISSSHVNLLNNGFERIKMEWWLLQVRGDEISNQADFQKILSKTRYNFESQGLSLINKIKSQSANGADYSVNASVFANNYYSSLKDVNNFLNLYLEQLKEHYLTTLNEAIVNLIVVIGILLAFCGLMAGGGYYLYTRILTSFWEVNEIADGIVEGDKDAFSRLARRSGRDVRELWATLGILSNRLTEQTVRREQFEESSEIDTLTTLLNRAGFEAIAGKMMDTAEKALPAWVILINIDHFNTIVDKWGAPAGDAVLIAFASMLKKVSRKHEIISRINDEEFAIIFRHPDEWGASRFACRILEKVRQLKIVVSTTDTTPITASIGVASGFEKPLRELMTDADVALTNAKSTGRNRICYGTTMITSTS